MEIVDTQVHVNQLIPGWEGSSTETILSGTLTAMETLGVDAILIDEYTVRDDRDRLLPGYELPNGAWRSTYEFAEKAVALEPHRFAYMARVDPQDEEMPELVAAIGANPHQLCIRVTPFEASGDLGRFREGGYRDLFAAARQHSVPIIIWLPDRLELLDPYLEEFPDLPFMIDHCGVAWPSPEDKGDARFGRLDAPISYAKYPNVSYRWSHAPRLSGERFPFRDLAPHLRRIVDAFGRERVMWGSDHTHTRNNHIWGESLYSVLAMEGLSEEDLEWILGRTARTILDWSARSAG